MEEKIRQLEELEKSWEEKMAKANGQRDEAHKDHEKEMEIRNSGRPQILNLDQDGMVDRHVLFDLNEHKSAKVGRKNKNFSECPLVILGGVSIQQQHAVFETNDKGTTLKALCKEAVEFISINGKVLKDTKPVTLKPNDRIIFGQDSVFIFKHTDKDQEASHVDNIDYPITFEFAMREKHDLNNEGNKVQEAIKAKV